MYLENPYQRSLTAKRLLKANLKAKVDALSLREPDELKKISFFYDSRAWLKAYFQYVLRVSKTPKKNAAFRSSKNRVFMQFFDKSTSLFIDEPQSAWDEILVKIEGYTLKLSRWDKGSEEIYDHLNLVFGFTPVVAELERLRKVTESVLGLPLAPSYKEDFRMRELRVYWYGPRTAHVQVSFEGVVTLSSTHEVVDELWGVQWQENTGSYRMERFEGDSLEKVLDQIPEEFDSDLIHFTDRDKLKALVKELRKIFPKVKIKDESYLQRGLGNLHLIIGPSEEARLVYKEETQKWEVWALAYIKALYSDAYNNKILDVYDVNWEVRFNQAPHILNVYKQSVPTRLSVEVSGPLSRSPSEFQAVLEDMNVTSKEDALHLLKLWAKWLDTVRTMPFPVEV